MNYIIDRRNFLKLIGLTTFSLTTSTFLTSCHVDYEGPIITHEALTKYNLATYINEENQTKTMYVKHSKNGKWYNLNLENNLIKENSLSITDYNITSLNSATNYLETYIGPKKEYTTEELKQTLEAVEKELNKENNKVLIK